jgi:hypothetical protein
VQENAAYRYLARFGQGFFCRAAAGSKTQEEIPNPKSQGKINRQIQKRQRGLTRQPFWSLGFDPLFGICFLGFGIWNFRKHPFHPRCLMPASRG